MKIHKTTTVYLAKCLEWVVVAAKLLRGFFLSFTYELHFWEYCESSKHLHIFFKEKKKERRSFDKLNYDLKKKVFWDPANYKKIN